PRAAAATQLLVLAAAALAAQRAFAQLSEQRRAAPDLAEALRAQVARDCGEIGTRRELAVGRDAAVLRAAGAARLVIEDRRLGVGAMYVPHEMRRALGADHHLPAVLPLPPRQVGEDRFVFGGREIGQPRAASRRDQEVAVERHRALLRRPLRHALQLRAIALGRRRLDDEVELLRTQPAERRDRVLERAFAVAEVVVIAGPE